MNIDQGLFRLDFPDHHAVLGIPIDADPKEARKRYLKIARRLHPDSLTSASDTEKQRASELLSKLVNPAYEVLSQEKAATEHAVVLRMRGQQLMQQAETIELSLETARSLMSTNNIEHAYATAVKSLAEKQYENLDEVLGITGQISELNLVYLTRRAGAASASQSAPSKPTSPAPGAAKPSTAANQPTPPPNRRYRETILEGYLNRAQDLEQKQVYAKAIIELREALRAFPNSGVCHSRLANVYLKAGQPTMARVHANRALEINASDEVAQRIQQHLEKTAPSKSPSSNGNSDSGNKPRGGLFGLFGGKKK